MTLPVSGPMSLALVQSEFFGSAPISLSEYYRGGPYTTNIPENNAVPTSGTISLGQFYGTRRFVPGSQTFTSNAYFTVPPGVTVIYMYGAGGGGGAGNVVDGGRNDDYGGAGGGSSGQKVYGFPIAVSPGWQFYVTIGAGGANAYGGRDSPNQGGTGGTTQIQGPAGTFYLLGGIGGYGGVGDAGNMYGGGVQTTSNSSMPGYVSVSQGGNAYDNPGYGGYGGAGYNGTSVPGGRYGGGNNYHYELDATDWGGGGAGGYSTYIREDNGNSPCWGGKGRQGIVVITW